MPYILAMSLNLIFNYVYIGYPVNIKMDSYYFIYIFICILFFPCTEERLYKLCITQKIEDEYHVLIDCPIYNNSIKICYQKILELCSNFNNMSEKSKFYYLFTNENLSIINIFGKCIIECLETRKLQQGL